MANGSKHFPAVTLSVFQTYWIFDQSAPLIVETPRGRRNYALVSALSDSGEPHKWLVVRPISTSRRIASARLTSCAFAQASRSATNAAGRRNEYIRSLPIAGRPAFLRFPVRAISDIAVQPSGHSAAACLLKYSSLISCSEKGIERIRIGAKFPVIFGRGPYVEFVCASLLLPAIHAKPLQVAQCRRVIACKILGVYPKRHKHFLQ
jgi:hypothetical protein